MYPRYLVGAAVSLMLGDWAPLAGDLQMRPRDTGKEWVTEVCVGGTAYGVPTPR